MVAFTGTWFGPVEELVPIGRPRDPVPEPPPVIEAGDFWGEDSASLHEAIALPDVERVVEAAPIEHLDAEPVRAVRRGAPPRRAPARRAIVAACAGALVVLAGWVAGFGADPSARGGRLPAGSTGRLVAEVALGGDRAAASVTTVIRRVGSDRAIRNSVARRSRRTRVLGHMHHSATSHPATRVLTAATSSPSSTNDAAATSYQRSTATPASRAPSSSSAAHGSQSSSPSPASLLGPGHCACE